MPRKDEKTPRGKEEHSMADRTLCIYHGGCDDGFGAAWVVRKALGERDVEFYPAGYQQEPPDVTDCRVLIVDFSYKRPVLEKMAKIAKSVTILDHHATAQRDLEDMLTTGEITGRFDMTHSGALMAWRWFYADVSSPMLLLYIEDRDLWRKNLPNNDKIIMALRSHPQKFEVWDQLMADDSLEGLRQDGEAIHRYYRTLADEAKRRARRMMLGGYYVPCVNAPHYLASEVAGELFAEAQDVEGEPPPPFAACYWINSDGETTFSLRSDGHFDVGDFAEREFGGGGHKGAAGFRVNKMVC